jgi:hypothetical protein
MKYFAILFVLLAGFTLGTASAADEAGFTEKYKAAFEAKDTGTLESFFYTTGSDPAAVDFYRTVMTYEAGTKISQIELIELTPEEAQKAKAPPGRLCLPLVPTKKLVLQIERNEGSTISTSTSTKFVAENEGKLVIPIPGACK